MESINIILGHSDWTIKHSTLKDGMAAIIYVYTMHFKSVSDGKSNV